MEIEHVAGYGELELTQRGASSHVRGRVRVRRQPEQGLHEGAACSPSNCVSSQCFTVIDS